MPQKNIELILLRQFSDYLATPVFLLDNAGILVYYNSAAADLFDFKFSETGEMDFETWNHRVVLRDQEGNEIPRIHRPINEALAAQLPVLKTCYLKTTNDDLQLIVINAIPIKDHVNDLVGLLTFFWKE